jgi:hypothetical protein
MQLKKIEKAAKIYQEITKLDEEILGIEKHSMQAATGESLITISITRPEEKSKEDILDSDGSLKWATDQYAGLMRNMMVYTTAYQKPDNKDTFTSEVIDTEALQIFGILLKSRLQKREALINRIQKLMA